MKKLFLFLIALCLHANVSDDLPKDFTITFDRYKKAYINKDAKSLYDLNPPVFRFLNSFKSYKEHVKAFSQAEEVKITKILQKTEEKLVLMVGIKLKNRKDMIYLEQNWYKLGSDYYVVEDIPFIFNY